MRSLVVFSPCSLGVASDAVADSTASDSTNVADLPAGYAPFLSGVSLRISGSNVVDSTADQPNRNVPYVGVGDGRHSAPPTGMAPNPTFIAAQPRTLTMLRPHSRSAKSVLRRAAAFSSSECPAGRAPFTDDIVGFDHYNGHRTQRNGYL